MLIFSELALIPKLKILFAAQQIAFVVPTINNVQMPDVYSRIIAQLEAIVMVDIANLWPLQCSGGIHVQLLVHCIWPLILMGVLVVTVTAYRALAYRRMLGARTSIRRGLLVHLPPSPTTY